MLGGLFVASLISCAYQLIKEKCTPVITAEQWGNRELMHEDLMNGVTAEQQIKYAQQGRYIAKEKYPEPHRNEQGQIMIENSQLWHEDLIKYGSVQTMKWVKQGKYNLEGEALKKEQERIEKHFEELMNLSKK